MTKKEKKEKKEIVQLIESIDDCKFLNHIKFMILGYIHKKKTR